MYKRKEDFLLKIDFNSSSDEDADILDSSGSETSMISGKDKL
jgi:hypothetical protein